MSPNNKVLPFSDLVFMVEKLKKEGKTVVQSHGVFDIIHPGIIQHLSEAKSMGHVLVVTVIKDKDVRRGPGRPVFPEKLRVESAAAVASVDYASVVDDETPFASVKRLNPDIFAKGQAYRERDRKIHDKIFEEEKELYLGKSKIIETTGFSFSTSKFINSFLEIYPDETKHFIRKFSQKHAFDHIRESIDSLKDLNVLVIGDGIVDEYHYCSVLGKSGKAPLVVNKYLTHEVFTGGVFAIANHAAGICNNVTLVTLLGREDSLEDLITKNLKSNILTKLFFRDDGPTIVKKRYINAYTNQKLFEINYLNDQYINSECESQIIDFLITTIPKYDLVLVSDFGHGFLTPKIISVLENYSKILAVNTQTNAANTGFNMITKYQNSHFVSLAETEARLAIQSRFNNIDAVARTLLEKLGAETLIVTLGKRGSISVDKKGDTHLTPVFSTKVIDTVGAGDAVFSYTALCFAKHLPLDLISFIGNIVGAIAVQIVCNKKSVERHELLELSYALLKENSKVLPSKGRTE